MSSERVLGALLAYPRSHAWARFGVAGLINAGFGYGVFAALVLSGGSADLALVVTVIAAIAFNFRTSRQLVFRSDGRALRFIAVYGVVLALNWAALRVLAGCGLSSLSSQALVTLPIAAVSFFGQNFFVFGAGIGAVPNRPNLVDRAAESFKPPLFKPNSSAANRMENQLRRFLDLQAGSIWRDLRAELGSAVGSLLDVGCGAQVYRDLIPAHVAYLGIDTSDAKTRFGYGMADTHYFDGDDWGIADAAFDTVLCTEVLEHVADPAGFLGRAFRSLRPGGRLVLTVPFAARWHFIPHDYWRFTPSGLRLLLTGAGFREVRVLARGNPLTVACYKIMTLQLMLLLGSGTNRPGVVKRGVGILLLPVLVAAGCIANVSLGADWGEDCLGYTVTARRQA